MTGPSARDRAIEQLTLDLTRDGCPSNDTPRWAVDALLAHPDVLHALAGTPAEPSCSCGDPADLAGQHGPMACSFPPVTPGVAAEPRKILAAALHALTWAREWREKAQMEGPAEGLPGERYDWYRQGSASAAQHDYHCVNEELRKVLGLPSWEEDDSPPVAEPPAPAAACPSTATEGADVSHNGSKTDTPEHEVLIATLTAAGWRRVGGRAGYYVRLRNDSVSPSVIVPTDPAAPDYRELMDAAHASVPAHPGVARVLARCDEREAEARRTSSGYTFSFRHTLSPGIATSEVRALLAGGEQS